MTVSAGVIAEALAGIICVGISNFDGIKDLPV